MVDLRRALLLWDPEDPALFDIDPRMFQAMGMQTLSAPYDSLIGDDKLIERIRSSGADAIVFTRNEDMPGNPPIGRLLAKTGMGYTTVSAIDPERQKEQTAASVADFLNQNGRVDLPAIPNVTEAGDKVGPNRGTFTLIFDMEQTAGVRFGLPRLLELIEPLGVCATFFITGFMTSIFPEVIARLNEAGHEIALHGAMHEFFTGRSFDDQLGRLTHHLREMKKFGEVTGANLIYRMDPVTLQAMAAAGISYFVLFRKHDFYRSRQLRPSTRPRWMRPTNGAADLILHPVSAETYQGDFEAIKNAIRSAWSNALQEGDRHISVLMHPFKDGSLRRLELTSGILRYLLNDLGLTSLTLNRRVRPNPAPQDATRVLYAWDGWRGGTSPEPMSPFRQWWWGPLEYHALRAEKLADALNANGSDAVLSAWESEEARQVAVFPRAVSEPCSAMKCDPLCFPAAAARQVEKAQKKSRNVVVIPRDGFMNVADATLFHAPRSLTEFKLVLDKIARKIKRFVTPT